MLYSPQNHTFCICAYKENPYLENCIQSILQQTVLGNVIISTSTPNQHIISLAEKYKLPMVVNHGEGSAADNFNFAYKQAKSELVTLCHQDDYYLPTYLEKILTYINKSDKMIILFTNYLEDREGKIVGNNMMLTIKNIINTPLRFPVFWKSKRIRKRLLSFGDPICCPSVTFHKKIIRSVPFDKKLSNSFDWKCWVELSALDGEFIYCPEKLMAHRIWGGSATTAMIKNTVRSKEDLEILCSLWPRPLAKGIFAVYRQAERFNGQKR